MMCMCGELNPSYVCSKHAGTPEDWRYWLEDSQDEQDRERRETTQLESAPLEGGITRSTK